MTVKEELFAVMGRVAALYGSKNVTVILCCEVSTAEFCTMTGYINPSGIGTVMNVAATSETINRIMNFAFDTTNEAANSERNE